MTEPSDRVVFHLDEGLPYYIAQWLSRVGLEFVAVQPSTPDSALIREIGSIGHRGVWITQDLGSRREHRELILKAGISVAWIDCGNASKFKKAFLVISFAYKAKEKLEATDAPMYFEVSEIKPGGIPSAVVKELQGL